MGVTLKNCASDIVAQLNGQTLSSTLLTTGDNLFAFPVYPSPVALVVECINSGGGAPAPFLSPTDTAFMNASVQVLIHALPGADGFSQGEGLARAVLGYIQQLVVSGYVTAVCRESAPTYLGQDPETQRNSWSINLDVYYVA